MDLRFQISDFRSGVRPVSALAMTILGVLLLVSCGGTANQSGKLPAPVRKEYQRGPVTVAVGLDRTDMSVVDRIHLSADITMPEDYGARITLPNSDEAEVSGAADQPAKFTVGDSQITDPSLADKGLIRQTWTWTLEPFLPGKYQIPPLKVGFWKKGQSTTNEMETDSLDFAVKSVLTTNVETPTPPDIKPVPLPRRWDHVIAVLIALIAVCIIATIIILRRRRTAGAAVEIRIPPHEIAFRALDELVAEDLPGQGFFKPFYQRVSDILRRYIEGRFNLHAPEQTTEEFLENLRSSQDLDSKYRPLLAGFLKECDMVKFAELQPAAGDAARTVDTCRAFIAATLVDEQPEQEANKQ